MILNNLLINSVISPLWNTNKDRIVLREDWRWELTQIFDATQYSRISCKLNGELTSSLSTAAPFIESSDGKRREKKSSKSGYRPRANFFSRSLLLLNPKCLAGTRPLIATGQINIAVDRQFAGGKEKRAINALERAEISRVLLSSNTGFPYVRHFGVFTLRLSTALPTEIVSREMLTLTGAEYRTLTLTSGDSWPINAQIIERKGGEEVRAFELLLSLSRMDRKLP